MDMAVSGPLHQALLKQLSDGKPQSLVELLCGHSSFIAVEGQILLGSVYASQLLRDQQKDKAISILKRLSREAQKLQNEISEKAPSARQTKLKDQAERRAQREQRNQPIPLPQDIVYPKQRVQSKPGGALYEANKIIKTLDEMQIASSILGVSHPLLDSPVFRDGIAQGLVLGRRPAAQTTFDKERLRALQESLIAPPTYETIPEQIIPDTFRLVWMDVQHLTTHIPAKVWQRTPLERALRGTALHIPDEDLALTELKIVQHLDSFRKAVSRALADLEEEGLIRSQGSRREKTFTRL